MSSLKDTFIKNTYVGLLHSDGELPASGKTPVYDGAGNESALSVGRSGNGVDISGGLTVGTLTYPNTDGNAGSFLYQKNKTEIDRIDTIPSNKLQIISPAVDGKYNKPKYIEVNQQGLVTKVETPYVNNDQYILASHTLIRKNGGIVINNSGKTVTIGDWTRYNLDDEIQTENGQNNPKAAILSISIKQNGGEASQRATFYVTPDKDVMESPVTNYDNLTPILSFYSNTGDSIEAGAQFITALKTGEDNVQFSITVDRDPTNDKVKWQPIIKLIGFIE
jgi:hypothetical protein